jgi:2-keto-3-deoxy-L-rhamnonate aldolase RhmA
MPTTTLGAMRAKAGNDTLIGTILVHPGAEWVELCGTVGFDFVCVDQMVTSVDWPQTAHMLRAAAAYNTSGWVRLSAYPWGTDRQGPMLQREVLRAVAVGAEGITASIDYPEDLAAMMVVQSDMHRKIWDGRAYDTPEDQRKLPSIFPLIESMGALENLSGFLDVEGIEGIYLGLGDLGRLLGVKPDVDEPEIRELVINAVEKCKAKDVLVMTNAGYRKTPEDVVRGVTTLTELGVGIVWVPYPTFVAYRFYSDVMQLARPNA